MKIAITGGTGFIGRRLVLHHLARGDEVRVLSRREPAGAGLPEAVKWCHGDLVNPVNILPFVTGADVLYHCAGQLKDASAMRILHVEGARKLAEAASWKIGRWVQLSSVGVYGPVREGMVTEDSALNPVGEYEITKAESDRVVMEAASKGGFACSILRPSNVFGAEMSNQSLFGMITMIDRGLFFHVGEPGASANYIHVDNVVDGLVRCATLPEAQGRTYNISDHCTMEEFVATIAKALDKNTPSLRLPEMPVRVLARWAGKFSGFPLTEARVDALTNRSAYSTDRIRHELGYRNVISMRDGLVELVEAWKRKNAH